MQQAVTDGGLLLDVRSPGEFNSGHLEGALNIPVGELQSRLKELGSTDRPVVDPPTLEPLYADSPAGMYRAGRSLDPYKITFASPVCGGFLLASS